MSGSELFKLDIETPELIETLRQYGISAIDGDSAESLVHEIGAGLNSIGHDILGSSQDERGRIQKN